MHIYQYQKKGKRREICNDSILCTRKNRKIFAGVADGAGNGKCSLEGSRITLNAVYRYLLEKNLKTYLNGYLDQRQYEIITAIRREIDDAAMKNHCESEDYASTLCSVCCDLDTGDFILINLGDGMILGNTTEQKMRIISGAENWFTKNHTYLTTTDGAFYHIRVAQGNLDMFSDIILMTDGAGQLFRNKVHREYMKDIICKRDFQTLTGQFEHFGFLDDASIIILSR